MKCEKCGVELKVNAKFCQACGNPVTPAVPVSTVQMPDSQPIQPVPTAPAQQSPVRQEPELRISMGKKPGQTAPAEPVQPELRSTVGKSHPPVQSSMASPAQPSVPVRTTPGDYKSIGGDTASFPGAEKKSSSKGLMVSIAIAVVLLVACVAVVLYVMLDGMDESDPQQTEAGTVATLPVHTEEFGNQVPELETSTQDETTPETTVPTQPETTEAPLRTAPEIQNKFVRYISASSYLDEQDAGIVHTPDRVMDGDKNTAWVEGETGVGENAWIRLTFDGEYLVSGLKIRSGYQKSDNHYYLNCRPKVIVLTFADGTEKTYQLQDATLEQAIYFERSIVSSEVTISIRSVYPGQSFEDMAISEITLF